jgi:ketosteroid isomerase-like protein
MADNARISAVEAAERRLMEAQIRGDRSTLEDLLADTFVGVNPDGSRVSKSEEIENLVKSGYLSGELADLSVRVHGDTAVATGQLILRNDEVSHRYCFTDVYVDQKLVSSQATLI